VRPLAGDGIAGGARLWREIHAAARGRPITITSLPRVGGSRSEGEIVHADPHAWVLTIPLTIALIGFFQQPAESPIKRWFGELERREALGWERLGLPAAFHPSNAEFRAALTGLLLAGLAIASLASVASFLGLIPA
jgi:hypothetical protein